ncbi:MAG: energy transducer TonB [Bacteroidetes bacterium]|nr:energy transducer TonB [Bacteroidota bacterium]
MKYITHIFLIIILLSTIGCNRQSDSLPPDEYMGTCEDGTKKAENDAKQGIYKLLSYGLPYYEDWHFQEYYEAYVQKNYGIEIGNGGCIVFDESECYSKRMEELIYDKFGNDIFDKAELAAKAEYKLIINEKIDTGFVFSLVDTMPEFMGGNDSLFSFLSNNFNNPNNSEGKVIAYFVIDKDGSISNIEIKKSLNKQADEEVIRVLNKMPKWNSGIYLGEKVKVGYSIPILFKSKENKKSPIPPKL